MVSHEEPRDQVLDILDGLKFNKYNEIINGNGNSFSIHFKVITNNFNLNGK